MTARGFASFRLRDVVSFRSCAVALSRPTGVYTLASGFLDPESR